MDDFMKAADEQGAKTLDAKREAKPSPPNDYLIQKAKKLMPGAATGINVLNIGEGSRAEGITDKVRIDE